MLLALALAGSTLLAPASWTPPSPRAGPMLVEPLDLAVLGAGDGMIAPPPFDPLTMLIQVGLSLVGGAALGFAGLFAGFALEIALTGGGGEFAGLIGGIFGGLIGSTIGVLLGVLIGGAIRGHDGSIGWTILTYVVAIGVGVALSGVVGGLPLVTSVLGTLGYAATLVVYHYTDELNRMESATPPPRPDDTLSPPPLPPQSGLGPMGTTPVLALRF